MLKLLKKMQWHHFSPVHRRGPFPSRTHSVCVVYVTKQYEGEAALENVTMMHCIFLEQSQHSNSNLGMYGGVESRRIPWWVGSREQDVAMGQRPILFDPFGWTGLSNHKNWTF